MSGRCDRGRVAAVCRVLVPIIAMGFAGLCVAAPDSNQILRLLDAPARSKVRLERGEIVAYRIEEEFDKELAVGIAMLVNAPVERVVAYIAAESLVSLDPDVVGASKIRPSAEANAFDGLVFNTADADEVDGLLNLRAGDRFNFSKNEIDQFRRMARRLGNVPESERVAAVSRLYRDVLKARWRDYREKGLNGIAPYARKRSESVPSAELRLAANESKILARYFPELQLALLTYPNNLPERSAETFFWINRTVEGRATPTLMHRITAVFEQGAVAVSREYYVGHSYNSSQLLLGCLRYLEGTLLFYVHRTYTDQVAGLGRALRRSIGRESLKKTMLDRFRVLRSRLNK